MKALSLINKHLQCFGYGWWYCGEWLWWCVFVGMGFYEHLPPILALVQGTLVHQLCFISAHIVYYWAFGQWYCEPPSENN